MAKKKKNIGPERRAAGNYAMFRPDQEEEKTLLEDLGNASVGDTAPEAGEDEVDPTESELNAIFGGKSEDEDLVEDTGDGIFPDITPLDPAE